MLVVSVGSANIVVATGFRRSERHRIVTHEASLEKCHAASALDLAGTLTGRMLSNCRPGQRSPTGMSTREKAVGIWSSIVGRREPAGGYRTVDGGHPAPYPDMTDEQLYNYELAFNIPRKTFDRPPRPWREFADTPTEPQAEPAPSEEAAAAPSPEPEADPEPAPVAEPARDDALAIDFTRPVRTRTTRQPVEIITTRARHPVYKVHGYIGDDQVITVFTLDGRLSENGLPFLENVPQEHQLWVNVYPNPEPQATERFVLTQHASQEEADAAASPERMACVSLRFDA